MKNVFVQNPVSTPPRSTVNLPHSFKYTCKMGQLIPVFTRELIPGVNYKVRSNTFARFFPMVAPPMHKVTITTDWYAVPMRLVYPKFPKWITGEYEAEFPHIFIPTDFHVGQLGDYLKYPCSTDVGGANNPAAGLKVSPHRIAAYGLIFEEYYRDQNLVTEQNWELSDGYNPLYEVYLKNPPSVRAWQHDYYTACLPFAQKGDEVVLPLGSFSKVDVVLDIQSSPNVGMQLRDSAGNLITNSGGGVGGYQYDGTTSQTIADIDGTPTGAWLDPNSNLKANTDALQAQADSIVQVRRAFMLQEFLERNARGGTRYNEFVLAHFDTVTPDARINRPEFIGRYVQQMSFQEVLSTAQTLDSSNNVDTPVGYLAGHGVSAGGSPSIKYYAREHCIIMGIQSIRPVTGYMDGLERQLTRFDRYDYPFPTFAHIGEQAVLNKEVYAGHSDPEGTFGYIPRYSEERFINSHVSGQLKTTLDFWHLDRKFSGDQTLNQTFVYIDPSHVNRIFADTTGEHAIVHNHFEVTKTMPLPRHGVPKI